MEKNRVKLFNELYKDSHDTELNERRRGGNDAIHVEYNEVHLDVSGTHIPEDEGSGTPAYFEIKTVTLIDLDNIDITRLLSSKQFEEIQEIIHDEEGYY